MQCLYKYRWVKLPRACLPTGKGLMGAWSRLAARAAFRKGIATYCGHENPVTPGMWSGGIVGLKSILCVRNRDVALSMLSLLNELGLVKFSLDSDTKHLTYHISDWIVEYSGAECIPGSQKCVFFFCSGLPIRQIRSFSYTETPGAALGLGKNRGDPITVSRSHA